MRDAHDGCGCGCERTTHHDTTHARTRKYNTRTRVLTTHVFDSLLHLCARARSRASHAAPYAAAALCLSTPRRPRLAAASTPAPPPPRSAAPAPPPARPRTHRAAPRAAAPTPGRQSCTTTSPPARGASRGRTTRRRWTSVERCRAIGEVNRSRRRAMPRRRGRAIGSAVARHHHVRIGDVTPPMYDTPHRTAPTRDGAPSHPPLVHTFVCSLTRLRQDRYPRLRIHRTHTHYDTMKYVAAYLLVRAHDARTR